MEPFLELPDGKFRVPEERRKMLDVLNDPELETLYRGYIESKCWEGDDPISFGDWIFTEMCRGSVSETSKYYAKGYEDGFSAAGGDLMGGGSIPSLKTRIRGMIPFVIVGSVMNSIAFLTLYLLVQSLMGEQFPFMGMLWFGLLLLFMSANFLLCFKAVQWFVLGVDDARKTIKSAVGMSDGDRPDG